MNDKRDIRLDLLLFSVGGVHFGVDSEQVSGIAAYDGESADDLFWFHEELEYGIGPAPYVSPTVVTIRSGDERSYRVIIDSMEDIAEFGMSDIHLFPELLEPFTIRMGLWGILPKNGIMVLLVDFQLLLKQKRHVIN
jgi:chemotaxis signal transduction protein